MYLRCTINNAIDNGDKWNLGLGGGNFKDCTISDKSGQNSGGIYDNCTFNNINGNIHGTFDIKNALLIIGMFMLVGMNQTIPLKIVN